MLVAITSNGAAKMGFKKRGTTMKCKRRDGTLMKSEERMVIGRSYVIWRNLLRFYKNGLRY